MFKQGDIIHGANKGVKYKVLTDPISVPSMEQILPNAYTVDIICVSSNDPLELVGYKYPKIIISSRFWFVDDKNPQGHPLTKIFK